jgi:putative NIF3 family GTP cyclohydrolase 1 type 2
MKTNNLFSFIHEEIFGNELMEMAAKIDGNANGVQVWGEDKIGKIALGVSCNAEFLEKASKWGADVCIFHHGMGLSEKHNIYNSRLSPSLSKQLRIVFENNMTIAGYHYCLDADKEIGNNALIIKELGAEATGETYFDSWGLIAEFGEGVFLQDLAKDCSKLFKHDVFMVLATEGVQKIKRFGVCSGGAMPNAENIFEIKEKDLELHLTGVITEGGSLVARESGFHYFACGHYATEVLGIKALGDEINEKFPELEVRFIDIWNEL